MRLSIRSAAWALLPAMAAMLVGGSAAHGGAPPTHPTKIVVFGDSLSDTGNAFQATLHQTPPSPPYFDGRFSNGPVWVEDFAQQFGLRVTPAIERGTNFAVGGAKVGKGADSLKDQVEAYLTLETLRGRLRSDPEALFVVFGGGNDISDALNSANPTEVIDTAAANIGDIIDTLVKDGAVNFLVPNLPNKGLTPAARGRGTQAEEQTLSIEFNTALDTVLASAAARHAINLVRVDLFALLQTAVSTPPAFGFTDASDSCLVQQSGAFKACNNPDVFVFWDDIHPTATAHAIIAKIALDGYAAATGLAMSAMTTTGLR